MYITDYVWSCYGDKLVLYIYEQMDYKIFNLFLIFFSRSENWYVILHNHFVK